MNGAERTPDLWIIENPWLRNAFRKPDQVEQAAPAAAAVVRPHLLENHVEAPALHDHAAVGHAFGLGHS
jgi:hypothetical protein